MTELQRMYVAERVAGLGHTAAASRLARRLDLDLDTIFRVLRRAEQDSPLTQFPAPATRGR